MLNRWEVKEGLYCLGLNFNARCDVDTSPTIHHKSTQDFSLGGMGVEG